MSRLITVRFFGVMFAGLLAAGCGSSGGSGPTPPVISTDPAPPTGTTGAAYPAFTFTSMSGGEAPFSWSEKGTLPPGLTLSSSGLISGNPTEAGTFAITVTVTDSSTPPLTDSMPFSLKIADSSISISTAPPPPTATASHPYAGFKFTASGGSPPYTWSVTAGKLPAGLTLNTDGSLSGIPMTAGSFPFTVTATDSASEMKSLPVTFIVNTPNAPIVALTPAPTAATATYPYGGFTFTASGGLPPYTWSVTVGTLPPGLVLGSGGLLSGSPTTTGIFPFTVTATDSAQPSEAGSQSFTMIVNPPTAPVVSPTTPPAGRVTSPYAGFTFTASGGLPPYTWSVTGGTLPPGLTLGSGGALSGTPTSVGTFPFIVTATDSAQPSEAASQPFTILVNTPGPPVINPMPAPPASVADSGYPSFNFTATGGYLPLSWAVTAGSLPPGLTLSTTGSLTGTPTMIGTFPFTVTVTDSAPTPEMNSAPFSISITTPPPPTINAASPPTATVGIAYSPFMFTASNGYLPLVWGETGALPTGLTLSPAGVLSGTPQQDGIFPITVNVTDSLNRSAPGLPVTIRVSLARPAAGFTQTTGSMTIPRSGHSATLLTSGEVLIAGGPNATAELYNPASETFTATGSMTVARSGHTATLLADKALPNYGYVLVAAGGSQTAELYDPTGGTFAATGSMVVAHDEPTATLLQNGQVLIAGGGTASAELYSPASGKFTATGSMTVSRTGHTATLLPNGEVLIAGGETPAGETATAELYNPASGTFTATGSMSEARAGHTATLLTNAALPNAGQVLIAGPDDTAEVFDPAAGTFSLVGELLQAFSGSTASLYSDGTVVFAGGSSLQWEWKFCGDRGCEPPTGGYRPVSTSFAEVFAPEIERFTATGSLVTARDGHTATVLADGTVLVAGGVTHYFRPFNFPDATTLASAEIYK